VVSGVIGAVNPLTLFTVYLSAGYSVAATGRRPPAYQTPCAFTGSIAAGVLTVTAIAQGVLAANQTISGAGIAAATVVGEQLTGAPGSVGTYAVSGAQSISSEAMTSNLILSGQMQAMSGKDLRQVEGLNLNGTMRSVYFNGKLDAIVRSFRKGGDKIVDPQGNTWLINQVLEQWPDWVKIAVTLQNGS
jgi:hypothetical protein